MHKKSEIKVFKDGSISFKCTSELYGTTDAGGTAENALQFGFVPLGDGCDYVLTDKDRENINNQLRGL